MITRQPMIPDNRVNTFMNTKFNNAIKLASIAMKSSPIESLQPFKEQPTINELIQMNKQYMKLDISVDSSACENPPGYPSDEFYIGKEALDLPPDANYSTFWPFWGDKISDKYSKTAAVKDLEDIWRTAFRQSLKIGPAELANCRVILVIPDLLIRCELRWIIEMLLGQLHFGSIVLQQENVCVTYSTGLPTACVVSMHETSISVSCIEEGISIPEGRIKLLYGTGDVLCLFHCLLVRIGLPRGIIDGYSDYWAAQSLAELFTTACTLTPSPELKVSALRGSRRLRDAGRQTIEMLVSTEAVIAGLALFHPALICKDCPRFQLQNNLADESEPDDPFDDLYLALTSRDRKRQRLDDNSNGVAMGTGVAVGSGVAGLGAFGNASGAHSGSIGNAGDNPSIGGYDNDHVANSNSSSQSKAQQRIANLIDQSPGSGSQQNDTGKALPLNDAIVKSIHRSLNSTQVVIDNGGGGGACGGGGAGSGNSASGNNNNNSGGGNNNNSGGNNNSNSNNNAGGSGGLVETSQQLCSVILAGELLELPGCVEWLQNALRQSLAQCGEVEVIHNDFTDGVPAHSAAWKGATMITLVGYCDDLWVSAADWAKYGSRAIREKAPFLW